MHVKGPFARTALAALALALLTPRLASAVDPNRALTQYVHRIWQVPQGLPQATIYAILQDSEGYLWLGSQSGLVRFDGVRFTVVGDAPFTNAWVDSIAQDRGGTLWIGTRDQGLFTIRGGGVSRVSTVSGRSGDSRVLLVDRDNHVWATAEGGAGVARISGSRATAYDATRGLTVRDITAACQAEDGTIWFGGAGSTLAIWNGAGFARYTLVSVPSSTTVRALLRASDGSIWVGTADGLVRLEHGVERRVTVADGLADNSVLALAESREGGVWVGTGNGFSRVRGRDVESFTTDDGLSQSTVYALSEDREGSFWVGTKHGLNQFLDGRTIPYTAKEGLPSNDTGPVVQSPSGTIWVGTLDAGLGLYDGHRFTRISAGSGGLPSNVVQTLARDADGQVWVGTRAGLARIRNGRVERVYTAADGLPGTAIRSLFLDRDGRLWVGTAKGTATIERGAIARGVGGGPPSERTVVAFAQDAAGRIVAAVEDGGIYRRDASGWTELRQSGAPIPGVDALYADTDGRLWMGTAGSGLWLAEGETVTRYTMRDGLFDDEIFGIAPDASGRLWMACSKGIFSVNRGDLTRFAAGAIRRFASTPYSPTDALRTLECRSGVQPAVWAMADGRLWFSTIRGVIVIDPNHLDRRLPAPQVVVEDVLANGQRRRPEGTLQLPAGANNLEFVYTALSFIAPTRIVFRYMLEGFDRDWNNAGARREAFYTNLSPGSFRFRVMACNIDGTCAETSHPIAFAIAPRVYQRRWFLPACVALALLLAWAVYRLRVRRLRAEFAIVLGERNRIARELHDTLIQGFSGITMELQALAGRLAGARERADLEEIIGDAGWCLREARQSLAGLRSGQGGASGLAAAVEQTARQMTGQKGVRLKLKIDAVIPDVPASAGYNIVRIEQEAIANALKHSAALTVEVGLRRSPLGVELWVADDGEGFESDEDAFARLGHYGLVGMRERAREMSGELTIRSARGSGTTVTVTVPVAETVAAAEPAPAKEHRKAG